jgi:hypothetical protein
VKFVPLVKVVRRWRQLQLQAAPATPAKVPNMLSHDPTTGHRTAIQAHSVVHSVAVAHHSIVQVSMPELKAHHNSIK